MAGLVSRWHQRHRKRQVRQVRLQELMMELRHQGLAHLSDQWRRCIQSCHEEEDFREEPAVELDKTKL